jgi:septum site-determining protein MinD
MAETIVITSGKGGVGKTTSVANLGSGLAMLGKKVAMIDADIGLRNLDLVMGLENRIVYDLVDVVEGYCKLRQALVRDKRVEGLYLLPAAQTRDKTAVSPDQMKNLCDELGEEFDYILVDCPAGIEQGFRNASAGADRAIIISTPELSAVRDADRVIALLESMEIYDQKLLVNRIRPSMVRRGDMLDIDDILEQLAIDLVGVIPEDEMIIVTTNRGEPAVMNNHSRAGQAYKNTARRIVGEEVPFPSLDVPEGLFSKLKKAMGLG